MPSHEAWVGCILIPKFRREALCESLIAGNVGTRVASSSEFRRGWRVARLYVGVKLIYFVSVSQTMSTMKTKKIELSPQQRDALLAALKARFEKNMGRHPGLVWAKVQSRLCESDKLWSLAEMERTGGEPDVVGQDKKSGEFIFFDCAEQTPSGRVSLCYDAAALAARKEHKPKGSAVGMAAAMGIELLTEEEYFALQKLGEFDAKRSSWLATPVDFRKQGGALWGGRSYGRIFIGCNGAESYYAVRGFRGSLKV